MVLFTMVLAKVLSIARSTWIESLLLVWPRLAAARPVVRLETIPAKSASQKTQDHDDRIKDS